MTYVYARRRYEFSGRYVRISEEFSLQLHGSESHKCRQLDIVSCIHYLSFSCNIDL